MRCRAHVARRAYSRPGQCQTVHNVQVVELNGKAIKGLCQTHRRALEENRLTLVDDLRPAGMAE